MPEAPISWGELIDKITILEIKSRRLTAEAALANVRRELAALTIAAAERDGDPRLAAFKADLVQVNEALWEIEDAIRERELAGDFGPEFIVLARSVYQRNDARAAIKRQINLAFGSEYIEEKSYSGTGRA